MFEIFQYDFMINAIVASILASIAFGIVGTYVVVKKIVFISGGISHTAYGGIGLGILLGFNPILGAIAFSLAAALIISLFRKKHFGNEDLLIGIMWSAGMALGVLFISISPGYTPNLMSYLFGSILTVPVSEIYLMLTLDVIIIFFTYIFFRQFQAVTFDEEFAFSVGLNVDIYYTLLLIIIALTTVVLIKLVGVILVIALISIPPAISIKFVRSLKNMMIMSSVIGLFITIIGLLLSYYLNLSTGAVIILVAVTVFLISNVTFSFLRIKS